MSQVQVVEKTANADTKFRCKTDHVNGWLNVFTKEGEGEIEKVYLHLQQRPESVKIGKIET
jgi:hypothetical protein